MTWITGYASTFEDNGDETQWEFGVEASYKEYMESEGDPRYAYLCRDYVCRDLTGLDTLEAWPMGEDPNISPRAVTTTFEELKDTNPELAQEIWESVESKLPNIK